MKKAYIKINYNILLNVYIYLLILLKNFYFISTCRLANEGY